jgi:hypothetical protein
MTARDGKKAHYTCLGTIMITKYYDSSLVAMRISPTSRLFTYNDKLHPILPEKKQKNVLDKSKNMGEPKNI